MTKKTALREASLKPLYFKIQLSVLEHLGNGLYASIPSILTEIIANAWDADASKVNIEIDPDGEWIKISDDGHGMSERDLQEKFLAVGYSRRDQKEKDKSESGLRPVMGRKGIGKLAMFSLANKINVTSRRQNKSAISFTINVPELRKAARRNQKYEMRPFSARADWPKGTNFLLTELNGSLDRSISYLRKRLARRFGVLGPKHNFAVTINGDPISRRDVGIWNHVQSLFWFDDTYREEVEPLCGRISTLPPLKKTDPAIKCVRKLEPVFEYNGKKYRIGGFIVSTFEPKHLGVGNENINQISIFAKKRVAQEDILSEIRDARYYNAYLNGEIHADFLDEDDLDRATSGREAIKKDDPLVQALRAHLEKQLDVVRDQWDEWRIALGYVKTDEPNPVITKWIAGLPNSQARKSADRVMTSISNAKFSTDDRANLVMRSQVQRSTIVGFERLIATDSVSKLDGVTDVFSEQFQEIFKSIDRIEETYFHDISRMRLAVIDKFAKVVAEGALERIVQDLLYDHLWLVDPTWDRIGGTLQYEKDLSAYLKAEFPDSKGARLDIGYRTHSGAHRVIELKKPGVNPSIGRIIEQCSKYRKAVELYLKSHKPSVEDSTPITPSVSIYYLISDKSHLDQQDERQLIEGGARVITYKTLLHSSRAAYEAYYKSREKAGDLQDLLDQI